MSELTKFNVGEKHVFQKKISEADAAHNYGTKRLSNLFATPGLVAMVIEASVDMVDSKLTEGFISIGNEIGVTHKKPTKVGETVTLELEIVEVHEEDNGLFIKFNAFDEVGVIAEGVHVRSIFNRDGFFEKVEDRVKPLSL